jgi:CRISPR-associated protein Cas2
MRAVVAYDVSDDRRRARLSAALERHGVRIQRSVYDLHVDDADVNELVEVLGDIIDPARDTVHLLPTCASCLDKRQAMGQVHNPLDDAVWIV